MTVKITKDYAPVVSSGARSGIKMSKCIGVTIHNTDNDGAGANAKAHANLLKNTWKNKQQSWHFAVDEDGAYQSIPTDEVAWHAGDGGTGKGNTQTVAIEICMNSDGDLEKATDNAAELAAQVLKEKGLSADDLYQHHDWSGKNCPSQIRAGKPYSWSTFKDKVAAYFNGSSSTKPDTGNDTSKKTISQIADEVIAGKWGNGEAREKALEDAGYDYDAVQAEVNKRYGITSDSSTSKPSTSTGGSSSSSSIKVGDKVKLSANATKYATGETIPEQYKGKTYTVMQLGSGKVLLKELYSWVYTKDVSKSSTSSTSIKVGDKVTPIKAVSYDGVSLISEVTKNKYTVIEIKGDRVVLGDGLNTAFKKSNLKK
jgi:N-acetylmuramoyl-L-alanine amidase CwlA